MKRQRLRIVPKRIKVFNPQIQYSLREKNTKKTTSACHSQTAKKKDEEKIFHTARKRKSNTLSSKQQKQDWWLTFQENLQSQNKKSIYLECQKKNILHKILYPVKYTSEVKTSKNIFGQIKAEIIALQWILRKFFMKKENYSSWRDRIEWEEKKQWKVKWIDKSNEYWLLKTCGFITCKKIHDYKRWEQVNGVKQL